MSDAVITAVLVSLIVGFFAVTIFSLVAMIVVRKKNEDSRDSVKVDDAVARMDSALDSALVEINKIGTLVKKELDEKYHAMLLLYDLIDEKKRAVEEFVPVAVPAVATAPPLPSVEPDIQEDDEGVLDFLLGKREDVPVVAQKRVRPAVFTSPRHENIWNMFEGGMGVAEIAKELGMGKGEVQLMLDFSGRS